MAQILTFGFVLIGLTTLVQAETAQQFYNAKGQMTGTATTNSNGVTTFRDGGGRTTGSATTNNNGITTFRNSMGQQTGTATRR